MRAQLRLLVLLFGTLAATARCGEGGDDSALDAAGPDTGDVSTLPDAPPDTHPPPDTIIPPLDTQPQDSPPPSDTQDDALQDTASDEGVDAPGDADAVEVPCTPEECEPEGKICTVNGCEYPPCSNEGDVCEPASLDQADYVCLYETQGSDQGRCLIKCNLDVVESCPTSSLCMDFSEGTQPFGACFESDCSDIFSSAAECSDVGPDGGTCLPFANGANFCVPAGTADLRAECSGEVDAPADLTCALGLLCVDGQCEEPCQPAADTCQAPTTCVVMFEGHDELGLCHEACEPFSTNQCTQEGWGCWPISSTQGICVEVGSLREGETCGEGHGDCAEGMFCLLETETTGTCTLFCSPAAHPGEAGSCAGEGEVCTSLTLEHLGICTQSCEPFSSGQCPETEGCWPSSQSEWVCVEVGTLQEGATCGDGHGSCAEGMLCLLETETAGSCQRICDPQGAAGQTGSCAGDNETCMQLSTEYLGVCEDSCQPYTSGTCPDPKEGCFPISDTEGVCTTAGTLQEGDTCGDAHGSCAEGMVCLLGTDTTGSCTRFCNPNAQAGQPGSCTGDKACMELSVDYLGACVPTCDPWAAQPLCGASEGCFPDPDVSGTCVHVGTTGEGQICSPPGYFSACAAGLLCVSGSDEDQGICKPLCLPFSNTVGACASQVDFCAILDTWVGYCEHETLGLQPGERCYEPGAWCAPQVACIRVSLLGSKCLRLCRVSHGAEDCVAPLTCHSAFEGDTDLGICE